LDESNAHYHTIIGLGIWNVVVTMLLFTVLVAVFIVCTNKRRSRLRFARRSALTDGTLLLSGVLLEIFLIRLVRSWWSPQFSNRKLFYFNRKLQTPPRRTSRIKIH